LQLRVPDQFDYRGGRSFAKERTTYFAHDPDRKPESSDRMRTPEGDWLLWIPEGFTPPFDGSWITINLDANEYQDSYPEGLTDDPTNEADWWK